MTAETGAAPERARPTRNATNEELVTFGVIPCRIGSEERLLRTRKIAGAREWKSKMASTLGRQLSEFDLPGMGGGDTIAALAQLSDVGGEAILDLVLEYDEAGALGGREHLEANADEAQVYAIFRAILERHFPFVRDVLGMLRELTRLMAETGAIAAQVSEGVQSPPANSPNGPSPAGTSAPTTSKPGSTKRS